MRYVVLVALAGLVLLAGCAAPRPTTQAYHVDSTGAVTGATRSALNGSTAPGAQEIIGIYLPFPETGLAVKAGLEWDGTPTVWTPPIGPSAAVQADPCVAPAPQQTYYVQQVRTVTLPVPAATMTPYVVPWGACP